MWVVWVFTRTGGHEQGVGDVGKRPAARQIAQHLGLAIRQAVALRETSARSSTTDSGSAATGSPGSPEGSTSAGESAEGAHACRFCFARTPHQHEEQRQQPQAAHHVQHEIAGTEQGVHLLAHYVAGKHHSRNEPLPHAERQQRRQSQLLRALG